MSVDFGSGLLDRAEAWLGLTLGGGVCGGGGDGHRVVHRDTGLLGLQVKMYHRLSNVPSDVNEKLLGCLLNFLFSPS